MARTGAETFAEGDYDRFYRNARTRVQGPREIRVKTARMNAFLNEQVSGFHRGRVVEQGTHDELLKQGGVYAKLHALQFAKDRAAA